MKNYDWKAAAEMIGIAAIVASLVFVGLQLKQSQEIAIADQYQDRADAAMEFYLGRMQSSNAIATLANDLQQELESGGASGAVKTAYEAEGAELLATRYLFYRANMTFFDNYHFQYEHGFLTEEAWQAFRVRLRGLLSTAVYAAFYNDERSDYRTSFQDLCDELLTELKAQATVEAH